MKVTGWLLFLVGGVVGLCSSGIGEARIWTILPDGSGDAPTIQAGVDSAAAGDIVLVACGVYHEHNLTLKSGITLRSETGTPDCVTLDAENLGRGILCTTVDNSTTIEGFTITGGVTSGSTFPDYTGAGLCVHDSSPSVVFCNFTGNTAYGEGGGVSCVGNSQPTFSHCSFVDNAVYGNGSGGGLTCWYGSAPSLDHCLVARNLASVGGGVFIWESSVDLSNCTITENEASTGGGMALYNGSQLTAFNTDFRHNNAALGADGMVGDTCEALLTCCDVDLTFWEGSGSITLDNEGCGPIAASQSTWGAVKAMYRE